MFGGELHRGVLTVKLTKLGLNGINLKSTDDCGNETRGTRMINIVQRLIAGQYINIEENGDSATISADISADYYDKTKINELLADLDTVKFKIVSVLPTVGASNYIYLVEKTAPEVGYDQYIWNTDDSTFYPIGDTDIDLSDYYTKLQTYAKTEVYNKTEADTKFQEKLTDGGALSPVSDTTTFANITLATKVVKSITGLSIWNYIVNKIGAERLDSIDDDTRISGINYSLTPPHKYFKASILFGYIMSKIGVRIETTMTDDTYLSNFSPSAASQVTSLKGSTIWSYFLTKLTTTIGSTSTNSQVPSNKAVYDYVEARRRYLHILTRYNNDSLQYPMGWCAIITDNATETYATIAQWLYDNQYRSNENSYYFVGGCCGTTGVRNQQDTGTTYIGRVTSGAFSADGTSITFKYDYNGTVGFQATRAIVYSHPLMKLTP